MGLPVNWPTEDTLLLPHVYKGPWKTMHGYFKIKQSSLSIDLSLSLCLSLANSWGECCLVRDHFSETRNIIQMISDQASFPPTHQSLETFHARLRTATNQTIRYFFCFENVSSHFFLFPHYIVTSSTAPLAFSSDRRSCPVKEGGKLSEKATRAGTYHVLV